ncbi:hypothetical protein SH2C18_01040 [Clostridium sediminicola]|uniref:restriction endonuclease n=1 Tax=Clostridium sediminicola TaxID=3114879 RepID=UPI0031F26930
MASLHITIVLLCLLLAFKVLEKILPSILDGINSQYSETKLNLGIVSLNFLSNLSYEAFNNYCLKILERYFHNNTNKPYSNNPDLISYVFTNSYNNETYVSIKKFDLDYEYEEEDISIDTNYVHKFIGALAHDNVKRGVLITNGNVSSDAKALVKDVRDQFRIILIDGINLTKLCWKKGCE